MTKFQVVAWFACFLAGILAIGFSLLVLLELFTAETSGSPERAMLFMQTCICLATGAIVWGVAAIIEILSKPK